MSTSSGLDVAAVFTKVRLHAQAADDQSGANLAYVLDPSSFAALVDGDPVMLALWRYVHDTGKTVNVESPTVESVRQARAQTTTPLDIGRLRRYFTGVACELEEYEPWDDVVLPATVDLAVCMMAETYAPAVVVTAEPGHYHGRVGVTCLNPWEA